MAHFYYINPSTGRAERYEQLTKAGKVSQRINREKAFGEGAVLGVTDILSVLDEAFWRKAYFGKMGIRSAIDTQGEEGWGEAAWARFEKDSDRPAEAGTLLHDKMEKFLNGEEDAPEKFSRAFHEVKEFVGEGRGEVCFVAEVEHNCEMMRYGGTPDWGNDGLYDFKFVENDRPARWKECAQLASYRKALSRLGYIEPLAPCWNIYINQSTGALYRMVSWSEASLSEGMDLFALAYKASGMIRSLNKVCK